jgi:hypothetical protein
VGDEPVQPRDNAVERRAQPRKVARDERLEAGGAGQDGGKRVLRKLLGLRRIAGPAAEEAP